MLSAISCIYITSFSQFEQSTLYTMVSTHYKHFHKLQRKQTANFWLLDDQCSERSLVISDDHLIDKNETPQDSFFHIRIYCVCIHIREVQ